MLRNIADMPLQVAAATEERSKVAEEMVCGINDISQLFEETALGHNILPMPHHN